MNRLDKYIEELKTMDSSPFLKTRVFATIEQLETENNSTVKILSWRNFVMSVSIVSVFVLGVALGSAYQSEQRNYSKLIINDTYIEQLALYNEYEYENEH